MSEKTRHTEQTKNIDWRLGAPRKIKKQLGNWYIMVMNVKYQRWFNGLPEVNSKLVVLDDNVRKNAEAQVDGYEMVFEVIHVPEKELVLDEGSASYSYKEPIVNVGDIVLCKGQVYKVHTEPVTYACHRDNFIAVLVEADERDDYTPDVKSD